MDHTNTIDSFAAYNIIPNKIMLSDIQTFHSSALVRDPQDLILIGAGHGEDVCIQHSTIIFKLGSIEEFELQQVSIAAPNE